MNASEEQLRSVFDLKWRLERTFFKGFAESFSLPDGVNFSQVITLMILRHEGPQCMTALSKRLVKEKGSFTTIARHLAELNYIEKVQDETDGRKSRIRLTPEGENLAERIDYEHINFVDKKLEMITPDERRVLFNDIEKTNATILKMMPAGDLFPGCN